MYILSGYILRLAQMIILILLWQSLAQQGADLGEFTLQQLLLYTLFSSALREQLNIVTPVTTAFWEGSLMSRYMRPAPVLRQLMAETAGSWIPGFLLYTLPICVISVFLGLDLGKALAGNGLVFLLSLTLSISLGFALDFIFAALVIYLKNANYTAFEIRQAVITLFSGALIPFALMPWGLGRVLELLPFGSVASAPLLILVGVGNPLSLLGLQLIWNLVLWPAALLAYRSSQERLVSYGG